MADEFTWNNRNSIARLAIDGFLSRATDRLESHPDKMPFRQSEGRAVLSWLRALADRKPSELNS